MTDKHDFTDFADLDDDNTEQERLYFDDGFPVSGDLLTEHCRAFVLEHDMPDDTDPDSPEIRQRVWNYIGLVERMKLAFKGVRP